MRETSALVPPDIDFDSKLMEKPANLNNGDSFKYLQHLFFIFHLTGKEPWASDTQLIIPVESSQVLIHESAAILGAQAYLNIARLPYSIKERCNAADISPNGKIN